MADVVLKPPRVYLFHTWKSFNPPSLLCDQRSFVILHSRFFINFLVYTCDGYVNVCASANACKHWKRERKPSARKSKNFHLLALDLRYVYICLKCEHRWTQTQVSEAWLVCHLGQPLQMRMPAQCFLRFHLRCVWTSLAFPFAFISHVWTRIEYDFYKCLST